MHILLTRPSRQGERTAAQLRARGHRVMHVPVLRIETNADADPGDVPCDALAVTSANAVHALSGHEQKQRLLGLPLFAVGERSAEAARAAGFTDVVSADGDVVGLVGLVAGRTPAGARILYLAGEDRAGDLEGALERSGRRVRTVVVYRAVAESALPEVAVRALQADSIDAVAHYSRRAAETLLGLGAAGSCLVNILKCRHFCLSAQVSEPLVAAGAAQVFLAQRPDEQALLELVGDA